MSGRKTPNYDYAKVCQAVSLTTPVSGNEWAECAVSYFKLSGTVELYNSFCSSLTYILDSIQQESLPREIRSP
jgi:hypothetical protein